MSRPLGLPVVRTSAFAFDSAEHYADVLGDRAPGFSYSRIDNPTAVTFAEAVARLEAPDGPDVTADPFASGMAAISTVLLSRLRAGDHLVAPVDAYGGTYSLCTRWLPRWGIGCTLVDLTDLDAVRAAITPTTRVVYAETVANPTLSVPDLPALAEIARGAGASLVVDGTFAPPGICRPLAHGAELVVHSATKFLGGHADATGGVVIGSKEAVAAVREARIDLGGCLAPDEAFLLHRGMQTLELRLARQCASAATIAAELSGHPAVDRVRYPGLPSHPQHDVAARIFDPDGPGFGGLVTLDLRGDRACGMRFCDALRLVKIATSLGGVASKVSHAASTTHRQLSDDALAAAGIGAAQIRLSVGLEAPGQLVEDLRQALSATST